MSKRLGPDDPLRAGYLWDNMDKIVHALLYIMLEKIVSGKQQQQLNQKPINIEDSLEEDEAELNRYLYGDFYISSKSNNNIYGNNQNEESKMMRIRDGYEEDEEFGAANGEDSNENAVRVKFSREKSEKNANKGDKNNQNFVKSASTSSESSTDEGKLRKIFDKNHFCYFYLTI